MATKMTAGTQWLYSFDKYGWKFGLERVSLLLHRLGDPQQGLRCVHVAGTNGKGSVCQYVASVLREAGYRVGVYISPHLQWFSERIVVDDLPISGEDIDRYVARIRPVVERMIAEGEPPTFFEITTALAFLYFKEKNVEYAVVEVGLGGRFDATNVITPLVSVITNIDLEHTEILGDTVEKIAAEKAGIIKEHVPVVTAATGSALTVIQEAAGKLESTVSVVDAKQWKRVTRSMTSQEFHVQGTLREYTVSTGLLGLYQGQNVAVALAAVEKLQEQGVFIPDQAIAEGISAAFHPGRLEIVSDEPLIVLDGAHNPHGMTMLRQTLMQDFPDKKTILVAGICSDKDVRRMLEIIMPLASTIILTKSGNPRACAPQTLLDLARSLSEKQEVLICDTVPAALATAMGLAHEQDLICVTGSLFTVGEARSYLFEEAEAA